MVHEVLTSLAPSYKHTRHSIEADINETIFMTSYPGSLGQVITNLINNAMIHAFDDDRKGMIRIEAHLIDHEFVQLTISDNGTGISKDNVSRIFDPFFTTKLGQGGSGLGLNIVHNIVSTLMQGKIDVSSVINEGSTFILTLPQQTKELETK
jgi:signal transduction histidine kinase